MYLLTLAPELTFWDSGELIYGAVTLGVPHSPGYPSFCMLGRGFSLIPVANAAFRLNMMSSALSSLTVYLLYRLVRDMGEGVAVSVPVAAASALSFAFAGLCWGVSVVAEVYTLNTLLLVTFITLLYRFDRDKYPAYFLVSAFVLGLALATHQSAVFLIPAFIVYFAVAGGSLRRPVTVTTVLFLFILGYSIVLYLPVRAAAGPPINIGDPSTEFGLNWVLKWQDNFEMLKLMPARVVFLAGKSGIGIVLGAAAFCAAGVWALRKRPYLLMVAISAATYYAGIVALTAGNQGITKWGLQTKFYVPAVLLAVPLVSSAIYWLIARGGRVKGGGKAVPGANFTWALMAFPVWLLSTGYSANDNSRNYFAFDFGTNTLKSVRQDAALLGWGDNGMFPLWYLQGVERYRDDVLVISTELMTHYWYTASMKTEMRDRYGIDYRPPANLVDLQKYMPVVKFMLEKKTPTYFDYSAARQLNVKMERLTPQGLVYVTSSTHADNIGGIWDRYVLREVLDGSTSKEFLAEGIIEIYGYECAIWAQRAYAEGRPDEAVKAYEMAKKMGVGDRYLDSWIQKVKDEQNRTSKP